MQTATNVGFVTTDVAVSSPAAAPAARSGGPSDDSPETDDSRKGSE